AFAAWPESKRVGSAVLNERVAERAALQRSVVDRDDPGASLCGAEAPAPGGRPEVADGLAGPGLAANKRIRLLNLEVGARGGAVVVGHPSGPAHECRAR